MAEHSTPQQNKPSNSQPSLDIADIGNELDKYVYIPSKSEIDRANRDIDEKIKEANEWATATKGGPTSSAQVDLAKYMVRLSTMKQMIEKPPPSVKAGMEAPKHPLLFAFLESLPKIPEEDQYWLESKLIDLNKQREKVKKKLELDLQEGPKECAFVGVAGDEGQREIHRDVDGDEEMQG